MFNMKKKMPTPIKDGIIGLAFGMAAIIPGVAGGTILLITGAFKKVTSAVSNLLTKNFWRNFLVLVPFGIGAILAFAALIVPLNMAMENCMFAIVCLFAGLIIGTLPTITDKIKHKKHQGRHILALIICLVITALIGVLSVILRANQTIDEMFVNRPWYLYLVTAIVGFVCASGLIVPGFSGSMLLVALCFYQPILGLFKFNNVWSDIALIFVFLVGAIVGFVFFSKLMNHYIRTHEIGTYFASLGLVIGSLIAIFINGKMFDYFKSPAFDLLDQILGPCLLVVGLVLGYLFAIYIRKHPEFEENAKN